MLPGAEYHFRVTVDAPGRPISATLLESSMTRHSADSFFDISYDVSGLGGTSSVVQILDNGALVGEIPIAATVGQITIHPSPLGGSLPSLIAKSTYGDSKGAITYVGPCDASLFDASATFNVAGNPPLIGDQLRICAPGTEFTALDRLECRMTNDGPWTIESSSVIAHGRHVQATGGGALYCWGGTCSVSSLGCPGGMVACPGGGCDISPLACLGFPPLGALHGMIIRPRDAASGLPTGKRQHSPLVVHVDNAGASSPSDSLRLSCDGSVDDSPETSIGVLDVTHDAGSVFQTSVQWPYRLSNDTRVQIFALPLHQEPGNAARTPLYEGPLTAPLTFEGKKGGVDKAYTFDPGDPTTPPSISLSFSGPTAFTTPDGGSVTGCTLTFLPDGPTPEVIELQSVRQEGGRHTPFHNKAVTTGPLWATGLAYSTLGTCDQNTDGGGWTRVSNIGSSGQDGVSLDLRQGEGGHLRCEPCPVTLPGASLSTSIRRNASEGFFDIAVSFEDIFCSSNNDDNSATLSRSPGPETRRVLCRDASGAIVSDLEMTTETYGECSPAPGSGPVMVIAFGFQPQEITSAGRTDPGLYLHFAEPVSFTPASGGPAVVCSSIEAHSSREYVVQYRESDYNFVFRLARLPDLRILESSVHQFRNTPHTGLGAAKLQAGTAPDQLVVSNIGSSGLDGVRIDVGDATTFSLGGGSGGEDRLTENLSLNFSAVPIELNVGGGGGGGRGTLEATGSFAPAGSPIEPLGLCSLDVNSDNVDVRCDFSAFGTSNARVVVLQDGVVVGQFEHGDISSPYVVGQLYATSPVVPALTGIRRKDMLEWIKASAFTNTEIDTLIAENFLGDLDGDGISDGEESARGTNVRSGETGEARRRNLASIGTGLDGLPHFQYRYVLGDVEGVEVLLRTTETLLGWNDDSAQFELVEVNPLPTGGTEYIWQRTIPLSGKSHELSGHVLLMK